MIVGLTGGIGSGKSTAAARLAELGARVIDADRVGHDVVLPGTPAHADVVTAFGPDVLAADGTIDRAVLGAQVFADPEALARLNTIVHPRIAREVLRRIDQAREHDGPIVLEAAVLLEAGWTSATDEIWVVVTDPAVAADRVVASRGLARDEVERRIASQMTNAARLEHADLVLPNDGTLGELHEAVDRAFAERLAG